MKVFGLGNKKKETEADRWSAVAHHYFEENNTLLKQLEDLQAKYDELNERFKTLIKKPIKTVQEDVLSQSEEPQENRQEEPEADDEEEPEEEEIDLVKLQNIDRRYIYTPKDVARAKALHEQGMSLREIGKQMNIHHSSVAMLLKKNTSNTE